MTHEIADTVAGRVREARRILFITGAGISADSGLPTYRGTGGLYNGRLTESGLPIEEVLSGEMFARAPEVTWSYLLEIERHCRGAAPNAAHRAIAELGHDKAVTVLTQNIDGLHRAAGSRDVIEIHGTLNRLCCLGCGKVRTVEDFAGFEQPPACDACGRMLRPDVVLFGEMLPPAALAAVEARLLGGLDLIVSVGTTSVFPYIAEPVYVGRACGIPTVEINPEETCVSACVDHVWRTGAAQAMTAVMQRIRQQALGS
jgi:NAD-dependent deacetylase